MRGAPPGPPTWPPTWAAAMPGPPGACGVAALPACGLAAGGGCDPGGKLLLWLASWACADTASIASKDTAGRTTLIRLDLLILEPPPWPCGRRPVAQPRHPCSKPICVRYDANNIADRLVAPCLVTN